MAESIPLQTNIQPAPVDPPKGDLTPFELAGGEATFFRLVERFYAGVAQDPVLRPLYPQDLTESIRSTALFLIQYCGGPNTYSQAKGHPRLRMRHAPFAIGRAERDAWVFHMRNAVEEVIEHPGLKEFLNAYFEKTATHMMNR